MNSHGPQRRYRELRSYVGWTDDDAARVRSIGPLVGPHLPRIVDDFYAEIDRHPDARKVITGGEAQIARLKTTLLAWIEELFSGLYDDRYVAGRWRVGWRHVEIGLDQVYTNVALSRIRSGLARLLENTWQGDPHVLADAIASLNKLLDLDLAIIEDAYQAEHLERQQRVERLATIGQVAGGVAHELRNPLNVIRTSVYYLLNAKSATPEKKLDHLKRIERHVDLANSVITALSNFAKMPSPQAEPFSLENALRTALENNPMQESVRIECSLSPGIPMITGDSEQIQIVFGNLFRNARDAMPDGGRLRIVAQPVDDATAVEVRVEDTGVGIDFENLKRVMEPLFTTKARGLGLGLAIARSIIDKHGGNLHVSSEPGLGSSFNVKLPAFLENKDGACEC